MKAEIMKAKGGARAIATMTYDDGLKRTAETLDLLCERYGCRATLALCTHSVNEETADYWRELFSRGRLAPMSHSTHHKYLTNSHPENLTEEIITDEIEHSLETLNKYLPEFDVLSFGIPYSSYAPPAFEHLYRSFYMARGGVCVLADPSHNGKMQSLDPVPGSNEPGGWYKPIGIRMMPEKSHVYPMITPDALIEYLDRCVRDGGWFLSAAHGIVEGENLDIKVEDLERIMARMQEYAERGELWVSDVNTVTKYIRERQNTTLEITEEGSVYTAMLTMKETTEDGLSLPHGVFNYPLTVRFELPAGARGIEYVLDGAYRTSDAFCKDGVTYAYAELPPFGKSEIKILT